MRVIQALALIAVFFLSPALGLAAERISLADSLPEKTFFYLELDAKRILEEGQNYLKLIDEETSAKLIARIKELRQLLNEIAIGHQIKFQLLNKIDEIKLYFVMHALDQPEVKIHKIKYPRRDENNRPIPDQFDEHEWKEETSFRSSFVLETDEESAKDFMTQLKIILERAKHKFKELEVEKGEMIQGDFRAAINSMTGKSKKDKKKEAEINNQALGRLGGWLVFSDGNPKELWEALMAPPEKKLSETPIYKRYYGEKEKPLAIGIVNISGAVERGLRNLKKKVEDLEKAAAEKGPEKEEAEGRHHRRRRNHNWELEMARSQYEALKIFNRLFSLEQCHQTGGCVTLSVKEKTVAIAGKGALAHGEQISPLLKLLLNGVSAFNLPSIGARETTAICARIGMKESYDEVMRVLKEIKPEAVLQTNATMALMKLSVGFDAAELLDITAGDLYLFLDFVEKDVEISRWEQSEGDQKWKEVKEKTRQFMPEVLFLIGLKDGEVARKTFSILAANLSGHALTSQHIKKRTFMETDVFCVGYNMAKSQEDVFPDGTYSYAAVVVDRFLSFGSWNDVTSLIRRFKSDKKEVDLALQQIVDKNKEANVIVMINSSFLKKVQQKQLRDSKTERKIDGDIFDITQKRLEDQKFGFADKEIEDRLKASLQEALSALKILKEKEAKLEETKVDFIKGCHEGLFYEIRGEGEHHNLGLFQPLEFWLLSLLNEMEKLDTEKASKAQAEN